MAVNIPVDLSTLPGWDNIDQVKQKAFLTAWLLVLTNVLLLDTDTQLVYTDADLASVTSTAKKSKDTVNYIDMRNIYPKLSPLSTDQVNSLFNLARSNPHFTAMAATYYNQGENMLGYSTPRYCLGAPSVLGLNT